MCVHRDPRASFATVGCCFATNWRAVTRRGSEELLFLRNLRRLTGSPGTLLSSRRGPVGQRSPTFIITDDGLIRADRCSCTEKAVGHALFYTGASHWHKQVRQIIWRGDSCTVTKGDSSW
jgi:hypothetical protein